MSITLRRLAMIGTRNKVFRDVSKPDSWKRPLNHSIKVWVKPTKAQISFHRRTNGDNPFPDQRNGEHEVFQQALLADHLVASGDKVAKSNWISVDNVSPVTSLSSVLDGIGQALAVEHQRGIINLDAPWEYGLPIPFLDIQTPPSPKQVLLKLSTFGRPNGWYVSFENRSIVHALAHHQDPIYCSWKAIKVMEIEKPEHLNLDISDSTVRIENCLGDINEWLLTRFLARYDVCSVRPWSCPIRKEHNVPDIYLADFPSPAWARAAVREVKVRNRLGRMIVLAQFPQQLLG